MTVIDKLARRVVALLCSRGVIDVELSEIYLYGAKTAIYTLVSTAGLLIIGCFFRRAIETILIIVFVYINQTLGGGFHAKTHIRCFLTMMIGLITALLALHLTIPISLVYGSLIVSIILLLNIPLVLHTHKKYLEVESEALIKRSRISTAIQGLVVVVLLCANANAYSFACYLGIMLSAVSRWIGYFHSRA